MLLYTFGNSLEIILWYQI